MAHFYTHRLMVQNDSAKKLCASPIRRFKECALQSKVSNQSTIFLVQQEREKRRLETGSLQPCTSKVDPIKRQVVVKLTNRTSEMRAIHYT